MEINEDEVFEKQESKVKPVIGKILKYKWAIIIVLVIAIIAVLEITTGMFSNLLSINQIGNSVGNIINCGYSAEKDGYIYYVSPSEDMNTTNINKVKVGTTEYQTLYNGSYDIRALNIVRNKIYFISIAADDSFDDRIDNKIYKMNLDGSELTVINDNEFAYDYYDMYIIKNEVYYIGTDSNVYKMDLNGGNRQLVAETGTGFLAINDKYIIYNKFNEDNTDFITYIKDLNSSNEKAINSAKIYNPIIEGDFIYYITESETLAKMPVEGGEEVQVADFPVYNMNVSNGYIYYLNYKDIENEDYTVAIFKLSVDGGESQIIKELSNYSTFLNIIGDYAYYMDMDEEKAFINFVNVNDLSEINLYEWKYNQNAVEN